MAQVAVEGLLSWPSVAWEQRTSIAKLFSHRRPARGRRSLRGRQYADVLVLDQPQGQSLWDAWDDPNADADKRYGWLQQIAELLQSLHQAGAVCESLRPDIITVTDQGHAVLTDPGELLPIPLPPGTQIQASLYTAPELVLTPEQADARADLYGFGAMLYALEYLHHGLEEKDFERQFSPKLITDRYPDVHPGFFRLVSKTFNRDLNTRFPTDEASKEDATGITGA